MKIKMSVILLAVGTAFLASGLAYEIAASVKESKAKSARAWTIACDAHGKYAYYDQDGDLLWMEFSTYRDASEAMQKAKYDHENKPPFDYKKAMLEKSQREAQFTACK